MNEAFQLSFNAILDSISFNVPHGKSLAVIGHNGAGKTTLFHVLLGLKFSTNGSFKLSEKSFGYVPERPYLEMESRFDEFLKLHLNLIHFPKNKISEEINRVADIVGLSGELQKKFKHFSKGMLQKSLLAQALLGSPKLMFLDEPMSGLDPNSRKELMADLLSLKNGGVTLIFTSHMMEDVEQLSDYVLVLDHGKQKFFGTAQEWRAL